MAVYREGYSFIKDVQQLTTQIFSDAADCGMPIKRGSAQWNTLKYISKAYGNTASRKQNSDGSFSLDITLMDEWAVSDERKTVKEATETYVLTYMPLIKYHRKSYLLIDWKMFDGVVSIYKKS